MLFALLMFIVPCNTIVNCIVETQCDCRLTVFYSLPPQRCFFSKCVHVLSHLGTHGDVVIDNLI